MDETAVDQAAPEQAGELPPAPAAPAPAAQQTVMPPMAVQAQAPAASMAPEPPPLHEQMNAEDAAWLQDHQTGKINPKTYADFMPKDTLGKIRSYFGLMLAGAGSGLTGQPNQVLAMMDKQISNDVEAQKTNQANKQTMFSLSLQHERDKIAAQRSALENQLTQAQIARQPMEVARLKAEIKNFDAEAKVKEQEAMIKATTATENKMRLSIIHGLGNDLDGLPDNSPAKQQGSALLSNVVLPGVIKDNAVRNEQAAGKITLNQIMNGSGNFTEPQFQAGMKQLRLLKMDDIANKLEESHVPGIPGYASRPIPEEARTAVGNGIGFIKQLDHFKQWSQEHSGDLNPADQAYGAALANGLQNAYREAIHGGVYKSGEQDFIAQAIDPDPTKFLSNLRVVPKLEAVKLNAMMQLDNHLNQLGFTNRSSAGAEKNKEATKTAAPVAEKEKPKSNTVERVGKDGRIVLYDAKTKKAIGYK